MGFGETKQNLLLGIEFMEGGDLFDQICKGDICMDEEKVKSYLHQILQALVFLHAHGLAHGDMKPENLLLDQTKTVVKLADFGSAIAPTNEVDLELPLNDARTSAYCPPELLLGEMYDASSDMWAVGCILYVLLNRKHPFDPSGRSTRGQIEANIVTHESETILRQCKHGTTSARDLLRRLLCRDKKSRWSAQEALNHPWFNSLD